jgi:cellobiose phosphorylase
MLNPIVHSTTQADAQAYRVEPYVIAADVYSVAPYVGMGGWTWYTGSSGWMYRLGIEAILGLVREGDKLSVNPAIPSEWAAYRIHYHFGDATYQIQIENPDGVSHGVGEVSVDGVSQPDLLIPLVDEKATYHVIVRLRRQGVEEQQS